MDEKELSGLKLSQSQTIWGPDAFQKDLEGFINKTQQLFLTPKKSDDLNATRTPSNVVTRINDTKRFGSLSLVQPTKAAPTKRASDISPADVDDFEDPDIDLDALKNWVLGLLNALENFLKDFINDGLEKLQETLEAALEAAVELLEASIESLDSALKALGQSLDQLSELVYKLETDLTLFAQDIYKLQADVANILTQLVDITNRVVATESKNKELESRIEELERRLDYAAINAECSSAGIVTVTLEI